MPGTPNDKLPAVHIRVEGIVELDGIVLLVGDVVVVIIVVEAINLRLDARMGKGGSQFVHEGRLFLPRHVEAGTVASVERFVLGRDGIDWDAFGLKRLYEADKVLGIVLIVVGIERAARP